MSTLRPDVSLGAAVVDGGTRFGVYSGHARDIAVQLYSGSTPTLRQPLTPVGNGFYSALLPVGAGALYKFVLDGHEYPDPFARFLPYGVDGPAMVCDSRFAWQHEPPFLRLAQTVIYELHVGTFTEEGTYAAAAAKLPELVDLGVTAVELMPLAAFAGRRGWGYDGVALFAPHAAYGTPHDLKAFVDKAHGLGLAVLLDVVYNHLGPSGNYLTAFYPGYFAPGVTTDWGAAPDFLQPLVRRIVVDNALYWLREFRFDGLRLDATHALHDASEPHILAELSDAVAALPGPRRLLIAEDERNSAALHQQGIDAIWTDDFYRQMRVTVTDEREGLYAAYVHPKKPASVAALAETIAQGWLYQGQIFLPTGKPRGESAAALPATAFVYCLENHDAVGNRALADRLSHAIDVDTYAALSTLLLFLPQTPLLFMGQEWAASTPFHYFTDHDDALGRAVREARRNELGSVTDPQDEATFVASQLRWDERKTDVHARILALYRALLALRKSDAVLSSSGTHQAKSYDELLWVDRTYDGERRTLLVNFGEQRSIPPSLYGAAQLVASGPSPDDAIAGRTAIIFAPSA